MRSVLRLATLVSLVMIASLPTALGRPLVVAATTNAAKKGI